MTDESFDALLIFVSWSLMILSFSSSKGDCGLTIHDVSLDSDDGDWQCQVTAAAINQQTLQSQVIRLLVLISPERPTILRNVRTMFTYFAFQECSMPFRSQCITSHEQFSDYKFLISR
jgi:hypothetical protein